MKILPNGNVGVNNLIPSSTLDIQGKTTTNELKIETGAQNGYILQSDADGDATWVDPSVVSASNSPFESNGDTIFNKTGFNSLYLGEDRDIIPPAALNIIRSSIGSSNDRNSISLWNKSNDFFSSNSIRIMAGQDENFTLGGLATFAKSYITGKPEQNYHYPKKN